MNQQLRAELISMVEEDQRVRAELAAEGSLFDGYHPRMEEVHRRNAARLKELIAEHGLPGRSLVGDDGAEAAWMIIQHAIGDPAFQRRGLELLRAAVAKGEAPPAQVAYLEDRIRLFEGRPQLYGTQFDWNEHGVMSPLPIEDPEQVEDRRHAVGLEPLAERLTLMRNSAGQGPEKPPKDWAARQREFEAWARRVGWRDDPMT